MRRACLPPLAALAVIAVGCSPLDLLGVEEFVTEQDKLQPPDEISDDRIEDKHPVYDPTYTIDETFDGCTVTLNKSATVTKLDIMPFAEGDGDLNGKLFHTYGDALDAIGARAVQPSMELVQAWLKPFNDGLYAAVELGAEDGAESSGIDKRQMLLDLLSELVSASSEGSGAQQAANTEAAGHVAAALELGGVSVSVPTSVASEAAKIKQSFQNDPANARPIGFYTWSPELERIFQQDRLLQREGLTPSFQAFEAMSLGLRAASDLEPRYDGVLALYAGLTNPYYDRPASDLDPFVSDASDIDSPTAAQQAFAAAYPETQGAQECAAHLAVLPASTSRETELFRDLYCRQALQLPPDSNLIDVFIDKIRSGEIDLTPRPDSGWYDYQTWALETLLVPDKASEKDHLFLTKRYKEKLIETFKTIITQNRETHAKQVDRSVSSSDSSAEVEPRPFKVYPLLPVEPFPTFYLRTARGYAFLDTLLRSTIGADFLSTLHRMLEDGTRSPTPLGDELHDKTVALYGLHIVAAKSIGMRHELTSEEAAAYPPDEAEARARELLGAIRMDVDVRRDPRVIVPIHYDPDTDAWRYWAVVGATVLRVQSQFYPGYEPEVSWHPYCVFDGFTEYDPYILLGKMVEVGIPANRLPPTRDEFRALCDSHGTVEEIVAALEGP